MLLSSFIHKSQKVQATQMSTNGWMDKQINSSYSGIFFSLKKGRKFWYMLQHRKTWRTLCEIKKASHKKTNIAWVHSYEAPRIVKYEDTESINIMVIARCYREEGKRGYFLTSSWRRQLPLYWYFLYLHIWLFLVPHMSGLMLYLSFCD